MQLVFTLNFIKLKMLSTFKQTSIRVSTLKLIYYSKWIVVFILIEKVNNLNFFSNIDIMIT